MTALGNDRWRATMMPKRIGRHLFTIEAWRDEYGSLCHALEVKHRAGIDVSVEIADATAFVARLQIEKAGYISVRGLWRAGDGTWHGKARNVSNAAVPVALDGQGKVTETR